MRVTTKGQVTIPKDIRDHLGIHPGSDVDFVRDADRVQLVVSNQDETLESRRQRFRQALDRMAGTFDSGGMDGKEFIDWLRGPYEDLDPD